MKVFAITVVVEGLLNQVEARSTFKVAVDFAVEVAAEQCGTGKNEIRKGLKANWAFISPNGNVCVSIDSCKLPEPKATERVLGQRDPHRLTIEVPVLISFTTNPVELDDRKGEKKPTRKSLLDYLYGAFRLEIDTEGEGQPEGQSSPPPRWTGRKQNCRGDSRIDDRHTETIVSLVDCYFNGERSMERISYEEAQDLLRQMIDKADAETITAIFEHAFARVCDGTASYDAETGEIEFEAEPEIPNWF